MSWTVTFSENVTGVDATDFALAPTTVSGASITSVTGSNSVYTVTANTGTGSGTLGLNLVDNDSIKDSANNPLGGTGAANGNFTGELYTIDKTAPVVQSVVCPGDSLQAAVDAALPSESLSVFGICTENILIRNEKERIAIDANGSATVIGATANSPVFNVRGKGILIQGLTITGGSDGIVVNRGSNAVIYNNIIANAIGNGITVKQLSFAAITNNTIHNNSQAGIWIGDQSTARIGFNSDTETTASVKSD